MRTADGDVNGNDAERSAMKIMFVTRSISGGGAERQLLTLAGALARRGTTVTILSFYQPADSVIVPDGVTLITTQKRGRWNVAGFIIKLVHLLRRERADIIHPYLPVPNVLVTLASPFLGRARIVFGLRASNVDLNEYDWLSALSYRLEKLLAQRADLLIANAEAVKNDAIDRGYPADRIRVIHNGIDTDEFKIDPDGGREFRKRFGIGADEFVIGHVGRFDPMKDHEGFIAALAVVAKSIPSVRAAIAGSGPLAFERRLRAQTEQLGITDRIVWTGPQSNMAPFYNSLNVFCSSSAFGEGFSNVVGEAMACEVPCVVTDVGDAAIVVGDTGVVVPSLNPVALAKELVMLASLPPDRRKALGEHSRQHIAANFTIDALATKTHETLLSLV